MGALIRRTKPGAACKVVLLSLWACDPSASRTQSANPAVIRPSAASPAVVTSVPPAVNAASVASIARAPSRDDGDRVDASAASPTPARRADADKDDRPVATSRLSFERVNNVGPAAPASAFEGGVVLITRTDELVLARLRETPSLAAKAAAGVVEPTPLQQAAFLPVARGPAIGRAHAYWISKGRLLRRGLSGGELEVLATDARTGTRVAVAGNPEAVAYISQASEKQDPKAKLRLSDGRSLDLTPEGAAASSVSLTSVGEDLVASYIDGRTGMTPVHARRLRIRTAALDPDVVVWVAGATQGPTEIASIGSVNGNWLLMPVERDVSHFGLVALALEPDPKMDPPLRWRTYENGLDYAPVAAQLVCGAPMALYVRPSEARPDAPQELVISELTLAETATSEVVASARGFADVSVYPRPQGAMLVYVADRHTWGRLIRCKK